MADPEQLKRLKQGVEAWNEWRSKNLTVPIDLSEADLRKADLIEANLSEANLYRAILHEANLRGANLKKAYIAWADLRVANLRGSNLIESHLIGTALIEADLRWVDLSWANLSEADLRGADLRGANLKNAQALGANFEGCKLTEAIVEDLHINSKTRLNNVDCKYIYMKFLDQERRPSDPNRNFEPGDFKALVQKALNTIDLIFRNGVDWQAFAYSFKKIQVEYSNEELAIQSIENQGDGIVVVRVNVSPDADKGKRQGEFMQGYEFARQVLEERYQAELSGKDTQITRYGEEVQRQQDYINNLFFLINQQQAVQKAMTETPKVQQSFYAPVHGVIGNNEGVQNIYVAQDLAEAAQQIQELLTQLQKTGVTVEMAQEQVATDLATQAKSDPTVMDKLVGWGQTLANKAGETTVSEAVKAVVPMALKLLGIPV